MNKVWGTIYNDSFRIRGYYNGLKDRRGAMWYVDMIGMLRSEEHFKFISDEEYERRRIERAKAREKEERPVRPLWTKTSIRK